MRALTYEGPRDIRYSTLPDPTPPDENGAVVRVSAASICGSDLHIFAGHGFSPDLGFAVGHEAVGEVVETGSGVTRFRVGDRVLLPASVGCSTCAPCRRGEMLHCENEAMGCYGISAALPGSQAEAVAVPAADTGLEAIPEGISDEQALLLTDNLPTAWYGARRADIRPGDTVAVVGLGPVGLCSVMAAQAMGAARVIGIDLVSERRKKAEELGAETVEHEDVVGTLMEWTGGRGADAVLEAVGADATVQLAQQLARREGRISVVGVNQNPNFGFNMLLAQVRCLSFHIGLCSVQRELPTLLPLVQAGRIRPGTRHHRPRRPLGRARRLSSLRRTRSGRHEVRARSERHALTPLSTPQRADTGVLMPDRPAAPLRIVQWSTGGCGAIAIRTIRERSDLSLDGVWVHSAEKEGRDAGELAGVEATGILASRDGDALIASRPDCICYTASGESRPAECIDDFERMLAAGINVVSTSVPGLLHPAGFDPKAVDRLQAAALRGGASLYVSGIEPGFAADHLVLTVATLSHKIRSIRTQELFTYFDYPVAFTLFEVFGFGKPLEHRCLMELPGVQESAWGPPVRMVADHLGVTLDGIRETYEKRVTPRRIEAPAGVIEAGTVGAVRFETIGVVDGRDAIVIEHINRMALDLAPEWPTSRRDGTYRIEIEGDPNLACELEVGREESFSEEGMVATTMRIVNAIPAVCAAPPGLLTATDLPLTLPTEAFV